MRSNYKKLGNYIQQVSIKNKDLSVTNLLGVSITKQFIPSIANTIGTDMSKYKVAKKGQFTYGAITSRNGDKISIALLEDDDAIVSTSYTVFEVTKQDELLPEYLMMWFRRTEFDRYARYMSHGSTREAFGWEDMCDVELPVPSPEKQKEIVKEYHAITDRIKLNEQLNQKLEDTGQSIYKEWFVNFEFPDENGKPYKSNGGEMVYCVELDIEIPLGWKVNNLTTLVDFIDGDRGNNYPKQDEFYDDEYCLFLNAGNVTKSGFNFEDCCFITKEKDDLLRKGKLKKKDLIITSRGTVGNIAFYNKIIPFENIRINSGMVIARPKEPANSNFIYELLKSRMISEQIQNYVSGSAQPQLPIKDLNLFLSIIPEVHIINKSNSIFSTIQNNQELKKQESLKLINLQKVLLSKMATIEG